MPQIVKAVVYLDPEEFHTTWLGNKSVYRTRMAMATGGELVVLAPAVERFGEDMGIDRMIRKCAWALWVAACPVFTICSAGCSAIDPSIEVNVGIDARNANTDGYKGTDETLKAGAAYSI
eukprot:SAG31_NODE_4849_length_2906_cov_2.398290_4_plen_120_part_00